LSRNAPPFFSREKRRVGEEERMADRSSECSAFAQTDAERGRAIDDLHRLGKCTPNAFRQRFGRHIDVDLVVDLDLDFHINIDLNLNLNLNPHR
jgi:hypothetical protein